MVDKSWKAIINQDDIDNLLEQFGEFHDSCIKEMRFIGDGYVMPNFSMGQTSSAKLRVIFQCQWKELGVIELEFDGIERFSVGVSNRHFPDIFDAALFFKDEKIYWANESGWEPSDSIERPYTIWIASKKLRWRALDEKALGRQPIYTSIYDELEDDDDSDLLLTRGSAIPI